MKLQSTIIALSLAAVAAGTPSFSQTSSAPNDPGAPVYQSQPAPIQRGPAPYARPGDNILSTQPAAGIYLKTLPSSRVETVAASADHVELRVSSGIANIDIHHPSEKSMIQVHLPGGAVNLLKDGLYTFNAQTNTVRVLRGEAETTVPNQAKPIKIKEEHAFTFNGTNTKTTSFYPFEARADLLLSPAAGDRGPGYVPYGYYGYPYGYPYYAYGYPYGWGWGAPYIGFGFGYRGGFRGRFR